MKVKECLLLSICHINTVHRVNFPWWNVIKALNTACHHLLSRLSERLTAFSVFYRSQMGRGAKIKCIKCPLLSFMNGLKDLQSPVIRPSIIVTLAWNLRHWPQKKPWGCCHEEYNFICQVIHPNINTLSNGKIKKTERAREIGTMTQDTTNYHSISIPEVYLQECCCNSILLHLSFIHHQLFHLSPELCRCGISACDAKS